MAIRVAGVKYFERHMDGKYRPQGILGHAVHGLAKDFKIRTTDLGLLYLQSTRSGKIRQISADEHIEIVRRARAKDASAIATLQEKDFQYRILEECIFGSPEKRARLLAEHFSERHNGDAHAQVICLAEVMHTDFAMKGTADSRDHILLLASIDWKQTVKFLADRLYPGDAQKEKQLWREAALLSDNAAEIVARNIHLEMEQPNLLDTQGFCLRVAQQINGIYPDDLVGCGRLAGAMVRFAIRRPIIQFGYMLVILKNIYRDSIDRASDAIISAIKMYAGPIVLRKNTLFIESEGQNIEIPLYAIAQAYYPENPHKCEELLETLKSRCRVFDISVN